MTSVMNWLNFNRSVYFGNATTMRDFRVQLRGNRSALLFGTYLVVLIGVAMMVYNQALANRSTSIVQAQSVLQGFYSTVVGLLGATVCLVAPALAATAVVMERQRKSIDLVFSAPVTPKYYLVGKVLSSYRYIWMILVLSLPVTAACVVLGGASWGDVLGVYLLLSLQALVLTSFSLLMSSLAARPVSAVLYSYAICLPYVMATSSAGEYFSESFYGNRGNDVPFFVALNPFTLERAVGTYMSLGGLQIPNWLLAVGFSLLLTKVSLLCAGSVLNRGGKEAKSLRIHSLVYMALGLGLVGWFVRLSTNNGAWLGGDLGRVFAWCFMPLIAILPFMACYGYDGENKFRPNGVFKARNLFEPTPATALPFLLTLITVSGMGLCAGYFLAGGQQVHYGPSYQGGAYSTFAGVPPGAQYALGKQMAEAFMTTVGIYVAFTIGLWTFFWSIARLSSSFGVGLKAARGITFAAFVLVCAMPVPILATIDGKGAFEGGTSLWSLWVLRPLVSEFHQSSQEAVTFSIILVLLAIPISFYAESRLKELKARRQAA